MKKTLEILKFALTGAGIGSIITTICIYIIAGDVCRTKDFAVWITVSALIGIVSKIMFSDRISLLVATAIHCLASFSLVLTASYICGYADSLIHLINITFPIFLIIYCLLYISVYVISIINGNIVNEKLNEKQ